MSLAIAGLGIRTSTFWLVSTPDWWTLPLSFPRMSLHICTRVPSDACDPSCVPLGPPWLQDGKPIRASARSSGEAGHAVCQSNAARQPEVVRYSYKCCTVLVRNVVAACRTLCNSTSSVSRTENLSVRADGRHFKAKKKKKNRTQAQRTDVNLQRVNNK